MTGMTLKSLYAYLRLLENSSELKRKMPASVSSRPLKEGLVEICDLLGFDKALFKDPQNIARAIGSSRFVMIWGEPSVTAGVSRIFDHSKVVFTVLVDHTHFESVRSAPAASAPTPPKSAGSLTASWDRPSPETAPFDLTPAAENLKPILASNPLLACRMFRVLFEHMLGFASAAGEQPGASVVNQIIGSRDHLKSFIATLVFVLGSAVDRDNLMSFMLEQGLFGMQIFEHLLYRRDYCDAMYSFRKLERAFAASAAEAEKELRDHIDTFNATFEGKPYGANLFEGEGPDKINIDCFAAALDVLETLALTPWAMSLNTAISTASSNTVRAIRIIAGHFDRFARGTETKEVANQEIAGHLLAFARQFTADIKAS